MKLIQKRTGKKGGEHGITIHILQQGMKGESKSLTVHGINVEQTYSAILMLFKAMEMSKDGAFTILIDRKEDVNDKSYTS